ncbi:hypothetical protein M405DRAFT_815000 [Rhizopogon salebrosus TDB-379]|nr:hypothetical protein M405DRAFT_815000 [Rhizopogon salebrosus TDB-379]
MLSSPTIDKFEGFNQASIHLNPDNRYMTGVNTEERNAWMHLLVVATECCRICGHKRDCEYRIQGAILCLWNLTRARFVHVVLELGQRRS